MAKQPSRPAVTVSGIDFSADDIAALKGGASVSGSLQEGKLYTGKPETFRPTTSVPISNNQKDIRPRTNGHDPNAEGGLVTAPNMGRLNVEYAKRESERLEAEEAARKEAAEIAAETEPRALLATLRKLQASAAATDRKLRTQNKQILKLQAELNALREASL